MKIYYDKDCGLCEKIKFFLEKRISNKEEILFLDINNSNFDEFKDKTIVVEQNGIDLKYEVAVKAILKSLFFPWYLLGYIPNTILKLFYKTLTLYKKSTLNKICKL
jgi:predicted DCC family thiol-disulfide oxidoreductase YuxK